MRIQQGYRSIEALGLTDVEKHVIAQAVEAHIMPAMQAFASAVQGELALTVAISLNLGFDRHKDGDDGPADVSVVMGV